MQSTESLKSLVHNAYSQTARSLSGASSTELEHFKRISSAFGYNEDDLELVTGANMGFGCGNPVATANIRLGEVVVDLGCGGGMDVMLASGKVGDSGEVYGIDISEDMLAVAKKNVQARNLTNVELIHSSIDTLPLSSNTVDCVVSNCVLNLVPGDEKQATLRETYRILKSGGRLAISDIVEKKPMPEDVKRDAISYVGCVAGAINATLYRQFLAEVGFQDILILDTNADLSVYQQPASNSSKAGSSSCCSSTCEPARGGINTALKYDINEFVGSFTIYALKP
ncbi:UbiE/COQ5 family methyltransferase, putative [Rhizoctonia solani AG-3 Rhs1AP]|uniref:Arsenite methyltransferase n=1 Tax=Rhizoctonia solani AG-3 Rhs1AP TaxID=1086054 RepID=X8IW59_9AGAM|nr:UbiE/COQ5 family methyltransferase, putative [Rhizoctonia solani AG-3 Rhs1AP]